MANTSAFLKFDYNPNCLSAKCASAIADTRLAYKLSATDHETIELCGDDDTIEGFPDRQLTATQAAAGELVIARRSGRPIGVSSEAINIGQPLTAAASGKLRVAVVGTDKVQGYAASKTTEADESVTIRIGC